MASAVEQQLFRRITLLTLLLGIMFGIIVAVAVLGLAYLLTEHLGRPLLSITLVGLFPPLYIMLLGAELVVSSKIRLLHQQLAAPSQLAAHNNVLETVNLVLGLNILSLGSLWMIVTVLHVRLFPS